MRKRTIFGIVMLLLVLSMSSMSVVKAACMHARVDYSGGVSLPSPK